MSAKLRQLKIIRKNPDNVSPMHVNDMAAATDGKEIFIQFLQIEPPFLVEAEEFADLESVTAIVKAKIVVSPEFAQAMVTTLSKAIEQYGISSKEVHHE